MVNLGLQGDLVVSLPVHDLEKSIAWYQEVLGFQVALKLEDPLWCELSTENRSVRVGLAQVREVSSGDTVPIFRVRDLRAAQTALASSHVATSDIEVAGSQAKLLTFNDLDGNALMLQELL